MDSHRAIRAETRLLAASQPEAVSTAARLLREGQLVVFPTDTLYGIGADAFNQEAIYRLFQVKKRPEHKGIPVLLADLAGLDQVAGHLPAAAQYYLERFWPGPLTLIVPKHPDLPAIISPNDGIAVRIPRNEVTREMIRLAGGAVATSSANMSGHSPACTAAQAMADLEGLVAAVLDDGPCSERLASTIVDCRGDHPILVRQGPISLAALSLAGDSPT